MATTSSTTSTTSNASLGQSVISSLNAGSGIDTASLITNLTAAQKAGIEDPITAAQTANAAQVSTAASIASDLSAFSTSLDTLVAGGTLTSQPTTSDSGVVGVSLTKGGRITTLSSQATVTQLALAQTVESKAFASGTTLAAGSLTISVNGTPTTVNLANASNSVSDVATAINAAKTGVTATVATDGAGNQRLVLKGATGASSAFTIASSDYPALSYSPPGTATSTAGDAGMGLDQVAQNAIVKVDGVTYERASNTIDDAIAGVTLTLVKTGTVTIGVQKPTAAIAGAISDFVSAYNLLKGELDQATAAATDSTDAGALRGNASIREMQRQLTKLTTTKLISSGSISTLAELGVSTARDGTLSVNSTTLNKMLAAYPDDVEAMFNPSQSSTNSAVSITSKIGAVASGTYALTGLTSSVSGSTARGSIDGTAMTGGINTLTAPGSSAATGLTLNLTSGLAGATATLKIDLGLSGALAMIKDAMTGTNGTITALQTRLKTQTTSLSDRLAAAEKEVTVYHDRLVTQFSAMNTRVSAYKATQSYLTQQVDLWTKSDG